MNSLIASLGMAACFFLYSISDSPERDCLLFAAVIIAINSSAERIADRIGEKAKL